MSGDPPRRDSFPFHFKLKSSTNLLELWEERVVVAVVGGGNLRYHPAVCGAWHRFDCGSGRDGACWELPYRCESRVT